MPKVCTNKSEVINTVQLIKSSSPVESNLCLIKERITNSEVPFYQVNLGSVYQQYIRWKNLLPRVQPFFAVKCQPDPKVIDLLGKLGAGFDCASKQEIKTVVDTMKYSTVQAASNIIFANPYKFKKDILFANRVGVDTVTFDTESELVKLAKEWPSVKLVLRVSPQRVYNATCVLGNKFGADSDEVPFLLQRANELSMNIVGLSFHVGSGCNELNAFPETVVYCSKIMELARQLGHNPTILDIGGGFPGMSSIDNDRDKQIQFENMCVKLNQELDIHFPEEDNYKIIAEPGRYFVYGAYTLVTQVIGLRTLDLTNPNANVSNVACYEDNFDTCDDQIIGCSSQESIPESLLESINEALDISGIESNGHHHNRLHLQHREPKQSSVHDTNILEAENHKGFRYVINDGVYNSFNCIVFDHAKPTPFGIFDNDEYFKEVSCERELFVSTVYGPTCDGFDCIMQQEMLPKMEIGNWIVWPNMGAYTIAASSCFNGIQMAETHYFLFEEDAVKLEKFLSGTVRKAENQFGYEFDSPHPMIVNVVV